MATYHVSAPVIFNANLKNETDAPIKCDISTTFKNQLLSNKSKFNVAVSKLRIPTTELVLMDIPNSTVADKYKIGFESIGNIKAMESLPLTSVKPIKSMVDFTDILNDIFIRTFKSSLSEVDAEVSSDPITYLVNNIGSAVSSSAMTTPVQRPFHTKIEVGFMGINGNVTESKSYYDIVLNTTSGVDNVTIVLASRVKVPFNNTGSEPTVTFDDADPNAIEQMPGTTLVGGVTYRSVTGMGALYTHNGSNGSVANFTITVIKSNGVTHGNNGNDPTRHGFKATSLYVANTAGSVDFPTVAPTCSITSDGKLAIQYQKSQVMHGPTLVWSTAVNNIFRFNNAELSSDGTFYRVPFDKFMFMAGNADGVELHTMTTDQPTIEYMSNIKAITLSSQSLGTIGEKNSDDTDSNAIMSFAPNFDSEMGILQYDISTAPLRFYEMAGNNLVDLDLFVSISYFTGTRKIHTLAPNDSFIASLTFMRKDKSLKRAFGEF